MDRLSPGFHLLIHFLFHCICVQCSWVFACVLMYAQALVHCALGMHGSPRLTLKIFFNHFPPYFRGKVFLLNLELTERAGLGSQFAQEYSLSLPPSSEVTGRPPSPPSSIHVGSGYLNSRLHTLDACVTSTLPPSHSLSLQEALQTSTRWPYPCQQPKFWNWHISSPGFTRGFDW